MNCHEERIIATPPHNCVWRVDILLRHPKGQQGGLEFPGPRQTGDDDRRAAGDCNTIRQGDDRQGQETAARFFIHHCRQIQTGLAQGEVDDFGQVVDTAENDAFDPPVPGQLNSARLSWRVIR